MPPEAITYTLLVGKIGRVEGVLTIGDARCVTRLLLQRSGYSVATRSPSLSRLGPAWTADYGTTSARTRSRTFRRPPADGRRDVPPVLGLTGKAL
jgi:hypothetical protein